MATSTAIKTYDPSGTTFAGLAHLIETPASLCDRDSLIGPLEAAEAGLITPILVGPEKRIRATAEEAGLDLAEMPLEEMDRHWDAAKAELGQ